LFTLSQYARNNKFRYEEVKLELKPVCLVMMILLAVCSGLMAARKTDPLQKYRSYLNDFMRVRGDASGRDVVFYWSGTVYSYIQGEKKQELFKFEGFNTAKTIVTDGGFQLLTREAAFFEDPRTGEILYTWMNPFTEREVEVVHIWNDPVNQDISFPDKYLPYIEKFLPSSDWGEYRCFNLEIFPFYPSPLPRSMYPEYSQSDNYQAGEFFQFFVEKEDLAKKRLKTIPAVITWTRISPWMPFMQMGDRAGNLLFVCRGMKLSKGFNGLPKHIKNFVKAKNPQFMTPPEEWSEPNETSWTYFRKLLDAGVFAPLKNEEK
jgi:hypothetical protein